MRSERFLLTLVTALLATSASARDLLPDTPTQGLRITIGVACDFEDRWWEAALYPGAALPLEFRAEDFVGSRRRERTNEASLTPTDRERLYALAVRAFDEFRIDRRPDYGGTGADRPWSGERTITLAAMTLDDELGRVDRVEIAIDVLRGRGLPEPALELVEAIADRSRLARLDLDCE